MLPHGSFVNIVPLLSRIDHISYHNIMNDSLNNSYEKFIISKEADIVCYYTLHNKMDWFYKVQ